MPLKDNNIIEVIHLTCLYHRVCFCSECTSCIREFLKEDTALRLSESVGRNSKENEYHKTREIHKAIEDDQLSNKVSDSKEVQYAHKKSAPTRSAFFAV